MWRAAVGSEMRRLWPKTAAHEKALRAWRKADTEGALRFMYDLDQSSLVWDLGGFKGDFAIEIEGRYRCQIEVFEPVAGFADRIERRFASNPAVTVHRFGLAGSSRTESITVAGDSSSVVHGSGRAETIELVDVAEQMTGANIDLLKVNIEGVEYELLRRLIETGAIKQVRLLQVQFHYFVDDAVEQMADIRTRLGDTHTCSWAFPWIWESWERLDGRGPTF